MATDFEDFETILNEARDQARPSEMIVHPETASDVLAGLTDEERAALTIEERVFQPSEQCSF